MTHCHQVLNFPREGPKNVLNTFSEKHGYSVQINAFLETVYHISCYRKIDEFECMF